jgi:cellobiose phosphorylase
MIWAFAQMGQGDRATELFRLINPIYHADTPENVERYQVEPYVIAADVYSVEPYVGRGGWTWYTGSASWMYRLGTEMILGLQRVGDHLKVNPSVPGSWSEFQINYRFGKSMYKILVKPRSDADKHSKASMDGKALEDELIPLKDDGQTHAVVVYTKTVA